MLFLSDYGITDPFAGICHAVIARIAPDVRVIDLTHAIEPHDVRQGALSLAAAVPYSPEDAVLLAVVDPGVGTPRRAVAIEAAARLLVGPDNGLLWLAAEAAGGAGRAVELPVQGDASSTFHGRDVFAPAAARLASGEPLERLGRELDPATLSRIDVPLVEVRRGSLRSHVLGIDRFGNVQLAARPGALAEAELSDAPQVEVRVGMRSAPLVRARTFADVPAGSLGVITDSTGFLAIVRNRGSAAETLGLGPGDRVVLAAPGIG